MASKVSKVVMAQAVVQRGGAWRAWLDLGRPQRLRVGGCIGYLALLMLLFLQPLTRLMLYAAHSDLNSHILLVPFISGYLLYVHRGRLAIAYRSSVAGSFTVSGIGIAAV